MEDSLERTMEMACQTMVLTTPTSLALRTKARLGRRSFVSTSDSDESSEEGEEGDGDLSERTCLWRKTTPLAGREHANSLHPTTTSDDGRAKSGRDRECTRWAVAVAASRGAVEEVASNTDDNTLCRTARREPYAGEGAVRRPV